MIRILRRGIDHSCSLRFEGCATSIMNQTLLVYAGMCIYTLMYAQMGVYLHTDFYSLERDLMFDSLFRDSHCKI